MNKEIEITSASIAQVVAAIKGTGPRVDRDTYKAHVPAFVSKKGEINFKVDLNHLKRVAMSLILDVENMNLDPDDVFYRNFGGYDTTGYVPEYVDAGGFITPKFAEGVMPIVAELSNAIIEGRPVDPDAHRILTPWAVNPNTGFINMFLMTGLEFNGPHIENCDNWEIEVHRELQDILFCIGCVRTPTTVMIDGKNITNDCFEDEGFSDYMTKFPNAETIEVMEEINLKSDSYNSFSSNCFWVYKDAEAVLKSFQSLHGKSEHYQGGTRTRLVIVTETSVQAGYRWTKAA